MPLDGSRSRIISFIPRQRPSARHQKQKKMSVEEQTAAGSIPSARLIASNAAWPHICFIYSSVRPSGAELLMGGGGRRLGLKTKGKKKTSA